MAEKKVVTAPIGRVFDKQIATLFGKLIGNCPADSVAVDVATLRADLNALLALIRGLNPK